MRKTAKHWIYLLSVLLLIPGGRAGGSDKALPETRTWPVAGDISLSSSYGEYRDGHLHAGIDIRTGGRDGVPCRAVGDGYLSRVRASPYGYGKVLYLHLSNGETAVYAHLSEFSPSLEEWVYQEQVRLGRYQVDLYPDSARFPVRDGDIIAYSGRTGANAPHLHFEIRDRLERPMNPLKAGWRLPDPVHPVIDRLAWIPLAEQSRIDGAAFPVEVTAEPLENGRFVCTDTISVSGPVGLAARIFDRHGRASGRLAPYRVQLFIDGERRSQFEMDRFSFRQGVQVNLIYEMERVYERREYFLTLFERPGESVWDRRFEGAGVIGVSGDRSVPSDGDGAGETGDAADSTFRNTFHTAEIHAEDCFGNTSILTAVYTIGENDYRDPFETGRDEAGRSSEDAPAVFLFGDLLSVRPDLMGEEGMAALFAALRDSSAAEKWSERKDANPSFTAGSADFDTNLITLPPSASLGAHPTYLIAVHGESVEAIRITELHTDVAVPERALYGGGFVSLSAVDVEGGGGGPGGELQLKSKAVRIGPLSLALRSFLELSFRSDEPWSGKEAVYRLDERKRKWTFSPALTTGQSISAHIRRPGVYAVLSDRTPPRIEAPAVRRHRMYADGREFPEIVISLVDEGAGLDAENTKILLDGVEQIARWDGFSKKSFVLLRDQNIIGTHGLTVIALDHAGNESRLQTSLTITRDYFSESDKRNGENVE